MEPIVDLGAKDKPTQWSLVSASRYRRETGAFRVRFGAASSATTSSV
jgi:hypothetical protein